MCIRDRNRAIEEMTGTKKEDIIGKEDYAYSVPWYNEHRHVLIDLIGNNNSEYISKYKYVKKYGKTIYAEVFVPSVYNGRGAYLWVTASPLLDKMCIRDRSNYDCHIPNIFL